MMSFASLVIANLGLILTNRSWTRSILATLRTPNAALWWVVGGALAFLALTIWFPSCAACSALGRCISGNSCSSPGRFVQHPDFGKRQDDSGPKSIRRRLGRMSLFWKGATTNVKEFIMELAIERQEAEAIQQREPLNGLTADEVLARRQQYGENTLPVEEGVSAWTILLNQFKSPLVYIILVAAGVSLAVGEYGDFGIIMAVVVIDAILGFVQEYQAQRTYTALKGLLKPTTTVIRDGQRQEVEVWELVPGDLVLLNAGEHVPGRRRAGREHQAGRGRGHPDRRKRAGQQGGAVAIGGQNGRLHGHHGGHRPRHDAGDRRPVPQPNWARSPPACRNTSKKIPLCRCA